MNMSELLICMDAELRILDFTKRDGRCVGTVEGRRALRQGDVDSVACVVESIENL